MIHFTTREQKYHLEIAAGFTRSGGWRDDAHVVAAYDRAGDIGHPTNKLRGVMVFQNHDYFGADVHFALAPGRRNTRDLMVSLLRYAFSPSLKDLPAIRAYIPVENVDMQLAALHMGFTIEATIRAGIVSSSEVVLMVLKRENCGWTLPARRNASDQDDRE